MAYAGHQFGGWVPQLGDGRALLLGEVIDADGLRLDIQLKGSGPTPFSRMGDGRAWIGPVLREYAVSEAMAALSIPTTRALAAVTTGETIVREQAMEWTEVVGDVWMVPGAKMKMGTGFAVPLSPMALEILDRFRPPRATTDLVFTSNGRTAYSNWSNGKNQLDRILEQQGTPVENWQFRDLRRSAATGMRSLGVDRLVVSKILAHKEGGVTKIYDRYAADPEKRAALVRWAQHVQSLVSGEPAPENVVPLLPLRATTD